MNEIYESTHVVCKHCGCFVFGFAPEQYDSLMEYVAAETERQNVPMPSRVHYRMETKAGSTIYGWATPLADGRYFCPDCGRGNRALAVHGANGSTNHLKEN